MGTLFYCFTCIHPEQYNKSKRTNGGVIRRQFVLRFSPVSADSAPERLDLLKQKLWNHINLLSEMLDLSQFLAKPASPSVGLTLHTARDTDVLHLYLLSCCPRRGSRGGNRGVRRGGTWTRRPLRYDIQRRITRLSPLPLPAALFYKSTFFPSAPHIPTYCEMYRGDVTRPVVGKSGSSGTSTFRYDGSSIIFY